MVIKNLFISDHSEQEIYLTNACLSRLHKFYLKTSELNTSGFMPIPNSVRTLYEGSSKSFRTFIFSRETVRAGGVVIGRV